MIEVYLRISLKPWALKILKPLWAIQVLFGMKLWLPDWAFDLQAESDSTQA